MEAFVKFFPLSTQCTDFDTFVRNLVIYIVAGIIIGLAGALLGWIPVIGLILSIVFWAVDLYIVIGIVLAVLIYFNIIHV